MRLELLILLALAAPATAAPSLAVYGALPGIEHVAVSPSGKRLAIVGVVDEAPSLLLLSADAQSRSVLGERKVRGVSFADDDHVLVQVSTTERLGPGFAHDRTEITRVVVIDLATRSSFAVFGRQEGTFGGVLGSYGTNVADGRPIGYFSTISFTRQDHATGSIEAGKLAKMVVLTRDPLETLANLKTIVMTVKRGRAFDRSAFLPLVEAHITDL